MFGGNELIDPTPVYLKECLEYDHKLGTFSWKHRKDMSKQWNGRFSGKAAFNTTNKVGYKVGTINSKKLLAHRVAWAIHYGEWPEYLIDHIDGNPINNRINNLRNASKSTNGMNRGAQRNNESGVKGVYYDTSRGKWVAQLSSNGKRVLMRRFDSMDDAIKAHQAASSVYHGEFSKF